MKTTNLAFIILSCFFFLKVLVLARSKAYLLWLVAELHRHLGVSSVVLRKEEPVSQRFLLNWNQVKTFLSRSNTTFQFQM